MESTEALQKPTSRTEKDDDDDPDFSSEEKNCATSENKATPHEHNTNMSCGRGIVSDARQSIGTYWCEEMTNFNQKIAPVSFFLFFACIAPAITFGGIFQKVTHNWIGAVEMLTATAWVGICYALLGGQPMMINGGTGPVLAFTGVLYKLSYAIDTPFITFYAWVGLWIGVQMIIAAFFDLNRFLKYVTRFTDEIFAFLISTIFIIDALGNPFQPVGVFYYFAESHESHDPYEENPDYSYTATAFLSFICCFGTTYLSFFLRGVKHTPYFPNDAVRTVITDFSVITSIVVFSLIDNFLFSYVQTERLNVPDTFAPTFLCCTSQCDSYFPDDCPDQVSPYGRRPWLVDLWNLNGKNWVPIIAAFPALLAFSLVFLDDGITKHLINHPCRKLTHGAAYNYDTVIIGVMIMVNSILGLPWLVAATVRSLSHVNALATKERSGRIIRVHETRLTNLFIHSLCLVCIFFLQVLKVVPMPVLYGVFLFMGLASLDQNQFFGRVQMFFMQPSKYPEELYTTYMKKRRMHLFTAIQLGVFVVLYVVKSIKAIAVAFPLVVAACVPIRSMLLPKIFSEDELMLIDSDIEDVTDWLTIRGFVTADLPDENEESLDQLEDDVIDNSADDTEIDVNENSARCSNVTFDLER